MNQTQTSNKILLPSDYTFFVKPTEKEMSQRKLESLKKLAEIKQWGLRNPTKFMSTFLGVDLLDAQTYVFMNSWDKPFCLWLESRGAGKSTMLALYFMTKGMLINNYWAYICSGTGDQSIETFKKIEDIAKKNIESMTGLTDVFRNELVINQANSDGFIHNPMGFVYYLYNGSFVKTLNSNIDKKRGKRANAVCFDEGSWLSDEIFNVIGAFTSVNKDFKLGGKVNVAALPEEFPNQLLYASSASSIDTAFYRKYRDFSKKMFLGDPRYFVADINCDVVINATYQGKIYGASLLSKETVDAEVRQNPEKGQREYYNQFTQDGGVGQIIKRSQIAKNSFVRPPVLFNDTGDRQFVLCYDPARSIDNSTILVGELIYDDNVGYKMDIVNSINFADIGLRKRTPMRTPEQIEAIKQLLLDYNGPREKVTEYENVEFLMDGGSGGGGTQIPDYFMEKWYEKNHKDDENYCHKGIIDKEYSAEYVARYPDAAPILHVLAPTKYKSDMYEALIKMIEADLISFPAEYDSHGYLNLLEVDEELIHKTREELQAENLSVTQIAERMAEINVAKTKIRKLTLEEEVSLNQIDLVKEEIVNICRKKNESGKDTFKLPAHKDADLGVENSEATMHDDRAYTLAMMGWWLSEVRKKDMVRKKKPKQEGFVEKCPVNIKKIKKNIG